MITAAISRTNTIPMPKATRNSFQNSLIFHLRTRPHGRINMIVSRGKEKYSPHPIGASYFFLISDQYFFAVSSVLLSE